MPSFAERHLTGYRPEQMFALVADVARYPEFLPWCIGAQIKSQTETLLIADLTIGFGPLRERFTSRVSLESPRRIRVTYAEGPFHHLNNQWVFAPEASGTRIDFWVDFEFKNRLLQRAMGVVFNEAVRLMAGAFLKRAKEVYDPPLLTGADDAAPLPERGE
jgi:coenzyme Q-binding protein COQ10